MRAEDFTGWTGYLPKGHGTAVADGNANREYTATIRSRVSVNARLSDLETKYGNLDAEVAKNFDDYDDLIESLTQTIEVLTDRVHVLTTSVSELEKANSAYPTAGAEGYWRSRAKVAWRRVAELERELAVRDEA